MRVDSVFNKALDLLYISQLLLRGSVRGNDLAGAEEDQAVDSHLAVTVSQQDCL